MVHGVVSLELSGAIEIDAARYDEYLGLSLVGFRRLRTEVPNRLRRDIRT